MLVTHGSVQKNFKHYKQEATLKNQTRQAPSKVNNNFNHLATKVNSLARATIQDSFLSSQWKH